jgi:catechol 2,3-dioxygenase-like lactoylglutathione lyase family enzyme
MSAADLVALEARAFVPARDFDLSKRFYEALGFALDWSTPDLASFRHGSSAFLLQNFHVPACTENFMMHLLVERVDDWWRRAAAVAATFGIAVEAPQDRPWGMRDFPLFDPSGVLWRIGQPVAD